MKKRLLFVINTLSKAGAEVALLELLKHFPEEEFETELFVLMGQGELMPFLPGNVRLLNTEYETSSVLSDAGKRYMKHRVLSCGFRRLSGFKNLPYLVGNYTRMRKREHRRPENLLWKVLSDGAERFEKEYDLAVAFLEGGSAYYVAEHVRAKKKAAVLHVDYERAGYFPELDRGCYDRFDRIFAVSEEVRQSFLRVYPALSKRVGILNNLIDQEGIRKRAEGTGFTDQKDVPRLLTVGRLTPQKGYDFAVRTMALLKKRGVSARWYVLGDGKCREELKQQIESLGLEKDFILLGAVENPYPYMKECDLYVHLTRFEGKSIAIQEALTLGCAVLVSDCSGNREQVEHGVNGELCEYREEAAADAIERLLSDPDRRMRLSEHARRIEYRGEEEIRKLTALMERGEE